MNFTRKQFAWMCGITSSEVSTYEKRGKIHSEMDGSVDSTNEINKLFHERRKSMGKARDINEMAGGVLTKEVVNRKSARLLEIEEQRAELDLKRKREDYETARLRRRNQQGKVIPVDLIFSAFKIKSESLKKSYYNCTEKFINLLSQRMKLSNSELSEIRTELIDLINETIRDESHSGVKKMHDIIDDYASSKIKTSK